MRLTTALALAGAAALGAIRPGSAQQSAPTPASTQPDISGHWTFNASQSDNPRNMMQPRDSGGDQEGGGGGRGEGAVELELGHGRASMRLASGQDHLVAPSAGRGRKLTAEAQS